MSRDLILVAKSGDLVGRRIALGDKQSFVVGTDPDADLPVKGDPLLAPRHFRLERPNVGEIWIRDLGSATGTVVNGRRVQWSQLSVGDVIRGGLLVLELSTAVSLEPARNPSQAMPADADVGTAPCVAIPKASARGGGDATTACGVADESNRAPTDAQEALRHSLLKCGIDLRELIARGGFGRVYRATRLCDGVTIAVKALVGAPAVAVDRLRMFLREMDVHRQLHHPHIVEFFASGLADEDQVAWFAMEFVPGWSLDTMVRARGSGLEMSESVTIVRQVLLALDFAHRLPPPAGPIVHRDVKPSNILVTEDDGRPFAKLADFGLAKNFELAGLSGMTMTGEARGSLQYMAPEQTIDSKYSGPEVDLYAVGGVLQFCLTGRGWYDVEPTASMSEVLYAKLAGRVIPLRRLRPDLPDWAQTAVERASGLDKTRRFRTARQMLGYLDEYAARGG